MNDSEYKKLYDLLRRLGYRKDDQGMSHLTYHIGWIIKNLTFSSVLDIGASSGGAIGLIDSVRPEIKTYGIDVSMIAVREGFALGREIVCGSAVNLPYKNKSFDLVVSSDTLEHIEPEDVDQVVSEITRVTKDYVFMQINPRIDVARWKRLIGRPLHRTIKPLNWWIDKFLRHWHHPELIITDYRKSAFCIKVK